MAEFWTRRRVLSLPASALLAAAWPPLAGAVPSPKAVRGAELYRSAFVLDGNTLASIGEFCCGADTLEPVTLIRGSGLTAVKSTLGASNGSFEDTVTDIAAAQRLVENRPDAFIKVIHHDDLDRAYREHKIAIIFSFEAASMLEDKIERIAMFRELDILVMQLCYNRRSPLGCGCLDGDVDGVTDLGRQAIVRMNALGVALDLSHANTQTTADGIALSKKPPVITHAGCRRVFNHPRNKEDREMKALADKGGVMGIYMLPFLCEENRQPTLDDYLQHMAHALNVCGEDHVGIGTDSIFFTVQDSDLAEIAKDEEERIKSGVAAPGEGRPPYIPELNTPRKLERVTEALLQKGYSSRVVEKVLGLNLKRVYQQAWTVDPVAAVPT